MASAVQDNESSFSRVLAQEQLENIDDIEDMSKQDCKRRKIPKTYYGDSPIRYVFPSKSTKSATKHSSPPEDVNVAEFFLKNQRQMRGRGRKTILEQTKTIVN